MFAIIIIIIIIIITNPGLYADSITGTHTNVTVVFQTFTFLAVIFSASDLVHIIVMVYKKSSGKRINSKAVPMNAEVMIKFTKKAPFSGKNIHLRKKNKKIKD